MASKKSAAEPDDLLAQLDDLGSQASSRPPKPTTTSRNPKQTSQSEQDLFAELGGLVTQRPTSRPGTPSLRPNLTSSTAPRSPKRSTTATPPPGQINNDDNKSSNGNRKSGDSTRSSQPIFTPTTTMAEDSPEPTPRAAPVTSGGGWWGGLLSTASAAVSQAQAAVKEIQRNEDAQKWAEQVRGNLGGLRGLGGDLRNMALPTFQNILQTIAPPISSHERLQIHITHDLSGYPTLDPLIYQVFSRVMSQVEGGDLMVIQRGQEQSPRRLSNNVTNNGDTTDTKRPTRDAGGWNDGPWWRSTDQRTLNSIKGMVEGTKLVRASAESYATEFFSSRGGVEEVAKRATETLSETNPTRNSDIFLAVQALQRPVDKDTFAMSKSRDGDGDEVDLDAPEEEVVFAIYLHDPIHGIAYHAVSQAMPQRWIDWIEAPSTGGEGTLPESIEEIIESGGVDPREWVSEWIEESLSLAVGVTAQRYVAKRMGVGEGGPGKGKMRADRPAAEGVVEGGAGEAARALGGM